MPEGDTIRKLCTYLRGELRGETITRCTSRRPLGASMEGRRVEDVSAHGKHLVIALEGGLHLRSHLGMYGAWHRYGPDERWRKPEWQAAVALWTGSHAYVCFNPREVVLVRGAALRERDLHRRLGPDLTQPGFDAGQAVRRAREFAAPETPMVDVLLDQRAAAGIGNVYKSELLFLEGIHPQTALGEVDDEALATLLDRAAGLLRRNLGAGPRVTRFADDDAGRLWVYGREGEPCLGCGTAIRCERLGRYLRVTYWCPSCQRQR